jgi:hypothetical protein
VRWLGQKGGGAQGVNALQLRSSQKRLRFRTLVRVTFAANFLLQFRARGSIFLTLIFAQLLIKQKWQKEKTLLRIYFV